MKLFFNYSIECELPPNTEYTGPELLPFFSGPETWEFALKVSFTGNYLGPWFVNSY